MAGLAPMITPAAPAPMYRSPNSVSRWLPSTPSPSAAKIAMSRPVNVTAPPSCHHHSGIRIASAPRPRMTDTSTAENEPSEYFWRSEEHTSELQSLRHLVCRLLLEKKKT